MDKWDTLTESIINSVHVDAERKMVRFDLTCQWGEKPRKQIIVGGVDDFVINEMRLSNIVDRVSLFFGNEAGIASRLFRLMRGREGSAEELEWPLLHEKLKLIRSGKLVLVEIEPVYGATAMVLGEDVRLSSIGED